MLVEAVINPTTDIRCPSCGSSASYRYGRVRNGRQRYLCLLCQRQFTPGRQKRIMPDKPSCPACGSLMHVYKQDAGVIRFRCSRYPECRTFMKREELV